MLTRLLKLPAVHPVTGTKNRLAQVAEVVGFGALKSGLQGPVLVTFVAKCPGLPGTVTLSAMKVWCPRKSLPRQTGLVGHHTEQLPRVKYLSKVLFWVFEISKDKWQSEHDHKCKFVQQKA